MWHLKKGLQFIKIKSLIWVKNTDWSCFIYSKQNKEKSHNQDSERKDSSVSKQTIERGINGPTKRW